MNNHMELQTTQTFFFAWNVCFKELLVKDILIIHKYYYYIFLLEMYALKSC